MMHSNCRLLLILQNLLQRSFLGEDPLAGLPRPTVLTPHLRAYRHKTGLLQTLVLSCTALAGFAESSRQRKSPSMGGSGCWGRGLACHPQPMGFSFSSFR